VMGLGVGQEMARLSSVARSTRSGRQSNSRPDIGAGRISTSRPMKHQALQSPRWAGCECPLPVTGDLPRDGRLATGVECRPRRQAGRTSQGNRRVSQGVDRRVQRKFRAARESGGILGLGLKGWDYTVMDRMKPFSVPFRSPFIAGLPRSSAVLCSRYWCASRMGATVVAPGRGRSLSGRSGRAIHALGASVSGNESLYLPVGHASRLLHPTAVSRLTRSPGVRGWGAPCSSGRERRWRQSAHGRATAGLKRSGPSILPRTGQDLSALAIWP